MVSCWDPPADPEENLLPDPVTEDDDDDEVVPEDIAEDPVDDEDVVVTDCDEGFDLILRKFACFSLVSVYPMRPAL